MPEMMGMPFDGKLPIIDMPKIDSLPMPEMGMPFDAKMPMGDMPKIDSPPMPKMGLPFDDDLMSGISMDYYQEEADNSTSNEEIQTESESEESEVAKRFDFSYYFTVHPHLLLIGGWDGNSLFDDIEVFPDYGCHFPSIPAERWAHMAGVLDDHLYVCGGFNAFFEGQSDCWSLNLPVVSEWQVAPSLPKPISTGSMVQVGGTLYVLGGDDGAGDMEVTNKDILSLKAGDVEWQTEEVSLTAPRMGACACKSDVWVVITGGTPTFQVAQRSLMHGSAWEDLPSLNEPERIGHSCVQAMIGRQMHIIVAGGENSKWEFINTVEHIYFDDVMNSKWEFAADLPYDFRSVPGLFNTMAGARIAGGWTTTLESVILDPQSQQWVDTEEKLRKGRWGSANVAALNPVIDAYCDSQ